MVDSTPRLFCSVCPLPLCGTGTCETQRTHRVVTEGHESYEGVRWWVWSSGSTFQWKRTSGETGKDVGCFSSDVGRNTLTIPPGTKRFPKFVENCLNALSELRLHFDGRRNLFSYPLSVIRPLPTHIRDGVCSSSSSSVLQDPFYFVRTFFFPSWPGSIPYVWRVPGSTSSPSFYVYTNSLIRSPFS